MARWLVKSDPESYSYDDLARDGSTEWSGVHNALALRHLRGMRQGDEILIYHSGEERAVVGLARVTSVPRADPRDDRGSWLVDIEPVRRLRSSISLAELRGDRSLRRFPLITFSRLSVMPVRDEEWRAILTHEVAPARGVTASPTARARTTGPRDRASAARRRR